MKWWTEWEDNPPSHFFRCNTCNSWPVKGQVPNVVLLIIVICLLLYILRLVKVKTHHCVVCHQTLAWTRVTSWLTVHLQVHRKAARKPAPCRVQIPSSIDNSCSSSASSFHTSLIYYQVKPVPRNIPVIFIHLPTLLPYALSWPSWNELLCCLSSCALLCFDENIEWAFYLSWASRSWILVVLHIFTCYLCVPRFYFYTSEATVSQLKWWRNSNPFK